MRLVFHNLLMCPDQKCQLNGFPLKIVVSKTKYVQSPYNKNKTYKVAKKLDWEGLRKTVKSLGQDNIPSKFQQIKEEDDEQLQRLHRYIYDTHFIEGALVCPNCSKEYPIHNGKVDMSMMLKKESEEKKQEKKGTDSESDFQYGIDPDSD